MQKRRRTVQVHIGPTQRVQLSAAKPCEQGEQDDAVMSASNPQQLRFFIHHECASCSLLSPAHINAIDMHQWVINEYAAPSEPTEQALCGGHGRVQVVMRGQPSGAGCPICGRVLRIEITEYKPGDEKKLAAGLPEELIGSAARSGMGLGRSVEQAGSAAVDRSGHSGPESHYSASGSPLSIGAMSPLG